MFEHHAVLDWSGSTVPESQSALFCEDIQHEKQDDLYSLFFQQRNSDFTVKLIIKFKACLKMLEELRFRLGTENILHKNLVPNLIKPFMKDFCPQTELTKRVENMGEPHNISKVRG